MLWEDGPLGVPGAEPVTILAADAIVDDPAERRRLHERTGADAADLESGPLARSGRLQRRAARGQRHAVAAARRDRRAASRRDGGYDWPGLARAFARSPRGFVRAASRRAARARAARRRREGVVAIGQVLLAAPRSFCAGVDRAIEIVEILLEQHGAPVYVRHQIVHNDHVVKRLEGLGAVFVDHENDIPAGAICVLSAHGVAPSVRANCESRGLRVVDAVCPLVSKVHAEARRYADSGHLVALVGHADHVEVIGTRGERPGGDGRDRVARGRGEARLRRQADRGHHADDALARRRRRDRRRARRALRRSASGPPRTTSATPPRTARTRSRSSPSRAPR